MNRYAQINDSGKVIAILRTPFDIEESAMILITEEFDNISDDDFINKTYDDGQWVDNSELGESNVDMEALQLQTALNIEYLVTLKELDFQGGIL